MTTTGTRLGRLLHFFLLGFLALVGLAFIASVAALGIAVFAPDLWPAGSTIRAAGGAARPLIATEDRVIACLFLIGGCILTTAILLPLIGLMRSAAAGAPFVTANVRRLRTIAAVFGVFAVAGVVIPLLATPETQAMFGMEGPTLNVGPLLMALTVLVLAKVFREGVRLREDNEGTI